MNETFYLSNIVPQDLDNNANFWYRLEAYCRSLAKRYSDVYIVSGPLYLPKEEDGKKIVKYEVSVLLRSLFTICVIRREGIELNTRLTTNLVKLKKRDESFSSLGVILKEE